jgi:hypothetical protein
VRERGANVRERAQFPILAEPHLLAHPAGHKRTDDLMSGAENGAVPARRHTRMGAEGEEPPVSVPCRDHGTRKPERIMFRSLAKATRDARYRLTLGPAHAA